MAARVRMRCLHQARPHVSPRCASRQSAWSLAELHRARGIAQSYLKKVAEGEERWKARAQMIAKGESRHMWDILGERGFIKDVAGNSERIKEIMRIKRIGAYVGIDPTADSLHLGHLIPLMALFWMWFNGYPAVTLIGGATARIGDPTGLLKSREIMSNADISKNITKVHYQLTKLWQNVIQLRDKYGYERDWAARHALLNNSMWLQGLSMYDFTKRIARHTRLGPMLSRDTVKRRLNEGEGMSLGEFMYPLFQGWDFWHLYNKLRVQMQIGGSDQFGNIVSGIDALKLIRSTEEAPAAQMPTDWKADAFGLTVPLLTDSAGVKYGKSEGNALWLDPFKTSAYDLYGFLVRRSDQEVEKFLKFFTFIPLSDIQELMVKHGADPEKRLAQHTLAFEVLSLVHGSQTALEEANQHKLRFGGGLDYEPVITKDPAPDSGIVTPNNAPRSDMQLPHSIIDASPARILFATGLAKSVSEAHRLVTQQGAYVAAQPGQKRGLVPGNLSWTPFKMWFPEETARYVIDDRILILRKGKHDVRIVELVSDKEWQESGKVYPGQPNTGVVRRMREQLIKEMEEEGLNPNSKQVKKLIKDKQREASLNRHMELPNKEEVRARKYQHSRGRMGSKSNRFV